MVTLYARSQKLVYAVARALTDFHAKPPGDLDCLAQAVSVLRAVGRFKGFTIEDFLPGNFLTEDSYTAKKHDILTRLTALEGKASALSIGAAPVEAEEERAAQYRTQDHA